jgi:hypothetical protein
LDLKSIDDALKNYVMERIRKEIMGILGDKIEGMGGLS